MAKQTIKTTTKTTKVRKTYRKSQTKKDKSGHRRCKTCGRFM